MLKIILRYQETGTHSGRVLENKPYILRSDA